VVLRTSYSFEFFPPKDVEGEDRLWAAIEGLKSIAPDFVSVTYGAGGSTRDRSIRIAQEITKRTGISTVAHLTCVGSTRDELIAILHSYKEAGITSILALRGDPTGGPSAPWTSTPGGFNHADELVPYGHPSSNGDFDKDVDVLIRKEELGATFATTQFFFEAHRYIRLVEALAARGSKLVIIPGILPVTNVKLLHRMAELGGTPIPPQIAEAFAKVENDPHAVRQLGVEIATSLCKELLAAGAPGLHFYTMNSSTATQEIYRKLNNVK
jgi:methylenetetrahydrofolate reductase (NADPH)